MTLSLRTAAASDCRLLYEFVNRPDSLHNKRATKGAIPWREHERWFADRLADPDCRIWILVLDDQAVGQLRLVRGRRGWEIDVYVVEEHRRRGLARRAISEGVKAVRQDGGRDPIVARVMPHNRASRQLFESVGFRLAGEETDHFLYMI
jgi:RimJ/RimL family protein N-acetyltransferase